MEKRTTIRIERDPGFVARASDVARSLVFRKPREYIFDGHVDSKGYAVGETRDNEPLRLRVKANDNGTVPTSVYHNLVDALKVAKGNPEDHPILVEYNPNLQITDWDLKLRVQGEYRRAA